MNKPGLLSARSKCLDGHGKEEALSSLLYTSPKISVKIKMGTQECAFDKMRDILMC